jgi:serine/threonine protein kinase
MMRRVSLCPEPSVLERLLDDSLTSRERRAVERHVHVCEACQTRLEGLSYDQHGTPRSIPCPDREVLRRYNDGSLGDFAWETIENHLETCAGCQELTEAIASGEEPGPEPTPCPESRMLRALIDGRLTGSSQSAIEAHLGECEDCQARIESLSGGEDDWPQRLRELRNVQAVESPGLKRVIGTLKDELSAENEPVSRHAAADVTEVLHFLDPPELEGDLGKLGPYRVLQMLGQGGMGLVLRAFDPALNRPIAIKVLAPQLASSGAARQRFAREARAAAAIRDEHVVAIHAVDEWKGLPYLVMEFIPGVSLQERINATAPLELSSILRIGMQTAKGLTAAHAQGLVHRDIKPSNILLENGVERVKLTDFGLARAGDDASITQSGVVAGSPLFMAPEQARGETVDHRADLFGLGAVMYAMCTGRSPFRASTTLGVLRRVCDDEPRPIREVNTDVPEWLVEIIDRLLAKDRRDRFQSARDVAGILGERLAQRQRGPSAATTSFHEPRPLTQIAGEDVGPAKNSRQRWCRWRSLVFAIAVLTLFFALTEATGVTHGLERISAALGGRAAYATLEVTRQDPNLRILVDGTEIEETRVRKTNKLRLWLEPGWHLVEGYAGNRRVEGYQVRIRPGRTLELTLKGTVDTSVGEAPSSSASASRLAGEMTSPPGSQADAGHNAYLTLCRDRLTEARIRASEQEKRIDQTRAMFERGFVTSRALDDQNRLLKTAYQDVRDATEALLGAWKEIEKAGSNDKQRRQEMIEDLFKADPEVSSLISKIRGLKEEIESLKSNAGSRSDPALVEARNQFRLLNETYNRLWQSKSEELKTLLDQPISPEDGPPS